MNVRCRNKIDNRLNETNPEEDNHVGKIDNLGDYNKGMDQVETDRNAIQIKNHHPKQENHISNPYEHKNRLKVMEINRHEDGISHFRLREILEDLGDPTESREQVETDESGIEIKNQYLKQENHISHHFEHKNHIYLNIP